MFGTSSPFGVSSPSPFGGTTSANPFGSSSSSPFGGGQPSNPFGSPSFGGSPFGQTGTTVFGSGTATGVFGSPQPGFGSSTPAFGAQSTPAFGSSPSPFGAGTSVFGQQTPGGFGAGQANPFGTPSFGQSQPAFGSQPFGATTPAFGAASTPAFGATATPAFGSSTPAFGASSTPAFGAASTPAFGSTGVFGASAPAFGAASTPAFGSTSVFGGAPSTPAFGTTAFGASPFGAQRGGSRVQPYSPTNDTESGTGVGGQVGKFVSISAMPAYRNKSVEELRWEDYQAGDKGGPAAGGQPQPSGGLFGQAQSQTSPFAASTPAFGSTPTNPFGAASTPSLFGTSTNVFGAASTPAFGAQSTPAFGSSPSPFGASTPAFGQASTPAFGQASTPAFGAPASTPAFGASSTPAFGSSLFGASTPAFGASTPGFGASSTPAFGFGASTPAFGAAASTPAFGASSSAFGGSSLFGASQASAPSFGFGASTPAFGSSTPAFGASSTPSFGGSLFGTGASTGFGFGQTKPAGLTQSTPAPSFGGFGAASAGTSSTFNFGFGASQPAQTPSLFGGSAPFGAGFGQQPQAQAAQVPQPISIQSPFGTLPAMPQVQIGATSYGSTPVVQYGISSMPVSEKPAQVRASTLLTPRHITPRSKVRMHARRYHPKRDTPKVSFFSDAEDGPATPTADSMFVPRENPRALFIRQPDQMISSPFPAPSAPDVSEMATPVHNGLDRQGGELGSGGRGRSPPQSPRTEAIPWPQKEFSLDGEVEESPMAPPSTERARPSPSKQNGVQSTEHVHRGNGYISITGHRAGEAAIAYEHGADIEALMPKLRSPDYYTEPRVQELAAKERAEPGYCRRVRDFTVGRKGYGAVKWLGETDVRRLDLESIVQFNKLEVLVYMDEGKKPPVGQGLNKQAEVTLLNVKCINKRTGQPVPEGPDLDRFEQRLRKKTEEQEAEFVSFDAVKGEWKFRVEHFSRYGLDDSDEDDEAAEGRLPQLPLAPRSRDGGTQQMDGLEGDMGSPNKGLELVVRGADRTHAEDEGMEEGEDVEEEDEREEDSAYMAQASLPHSLPAQLGLDPVKMQQMRHVLFSEEEEEDIMLVDSLTAQGVPLFGRRTPQKGKTPAKTPMRAFAKRAGGTPSSQAGAKVAASAAGSSPQTASWQLAHIRKSPVQQMKVSPSPIRRGLPAFTSPDITPGRGSRLSLSGSLTPASAASGKAVAGTPFSTPMTMPPTPLTGFNPQPGMVPTAQGRADQATDAGLFLGRSFRVGWGPSGVLVHSGLPAGVAERDSGGLSSKLLIQRVALDRPLRDKNGVVRDELVQAHLVEPLKLHMSLSVMEEPSPSDTEKTGVLALGLQEEKLRLRRVECSRAKLSEVCEEYRALAQQEQGLEGVAPEDTLVLRHQQMVWDLTDVLFSDRLSRPAPEPMQEGNGGGGSEAEEEQEEEEAAEGMEDVDREDADEPLEEGPDGKQGQGGALLLEEETEMDGGGDDGNVGLDFVPPNLEDDSIFEAASTIDPEAQLYLHRANFSAWLQEYVENLMEKELESIPDKSGLSSIFAHLTARQLEEAVGKAVERGDVRLACLLSQAGGSMDTRADVATQLAVWEEEGVGQGMIESERLAVLHLLAGHLAEAMEGRSIDWKRYLGLVMWYKLPPNTSLPAIIREFQRLVDEEKAPAPIPMYVEEGKEACLGPPLTQAPYDTAYYLMLLLAGEAEGKAPGVGDVAKMLRAASSTYDWLDARLAWHAHEVLQAAGVLSPGHLHAVHMDFAAQLLAAGQCHLAIYVMLHMPTAEGKPGLHERAIKEVLTLYCPEWCESESQRAFLEEELRLPKEWLHAAEAVYWHYRGDDEKELMHLELSAQWQAAHGLFMSKVVGRYLLQGRKKEARDHAEQLELHSEEVDNWGQGGQLLVDYFRLKDSFEVDFFAFEGLDSLEKRSAACGAVFKRLQEALSIARPAVSPSLRLVFTRMADELSELLVKDARARAHTAAQELQAHRVAITAPLPEDLKMCRLQDAVLGFTAWLTETTVM